MACSKCGGDHWNFVSCASHAAEVAKQKVRDRAPERVNRPREGAKDFGNRLHGSQARGQTVFIPRKSHPLYQERKPPAPLEVKQMEYPSFGDEAA